MSLPALTLEVSPLLEDQWTGIPVYTRRLAQALLRSEQVDLQFSVQLTRVPWSLVQSAMQMGSGTFLREELFSLQEGDYAMVDPARPLLFTSVRNACSIGGRQASTVHDLSTLVMPEYHEDANVHHHMHHLTGDLASDDITFCVSDATQKALHLYYPSTVGRTRVVHQYVDWPEHFAGIEYNLPPPRLGRYAVVLGTLEPRKNLGLLMRALSAPEIARSDIRFVVIGKKGWKVDQLLAELTPEQSARIEFSGFVSEFIKYRLLKHAEFLVYPTVYEGFGIPALEAMSLGKPVLSALTSSLPEVVGDAGVYFDPYSESEFAAAFAEISHPKKLAHLAPRALKAARAFNWQRMAAPVIDWLQ